MTTTTSDSIRERAMHERGFRDATVDNDGRRITITMPLNEADRLIDAISDGQPTTHTRRHLIEQARRDAINEVVEMMRSLPPTRRAINIIGDVKRLAA